MELSASAGVDSPKPGFDVEHGFVGYGDIVVEFAAEQSAGDAVTAGEFVEGGQRNRARELEVDQVFEFVGRVDQEELPFYYNAADVCVMPSYYESFGLAALESMACGTPVIATPRMLPRCARPK